VRQQRLLTAYEARVAVAHPLSQAQANREERLVVYRTLRDRWGWPRFWRHFGAVVRALDRAYDRATDSGI